MPKRTDIKKILIIGAGPIVIGQACEFDYSGTQACKALKEEGYEVVLLNSNPATIMTDPDFADRTYVEPVTPEFLEKIIARERPDALLPTLGGQTALNVAVAVAENGVLDKYKVELIGAKLRPSKWRKTAPCSRRRWNGSGYRFPVPVWHIIISRPWRLSRKSVFRQSSARLSPWVERAAVSPTI